MPSKPPQQKTISLGLQGGGVHAAFSWGVVDQLLTDGRIRIEAISATSGGAMLAAVMAQGMSDGGAQGARKAMEAFWKKISIASDMMPLRMKVVDKFLGNVGIDLSPSTMALDYITRMFSPYQFNLFDINPLRGILEEMVDFAMLNRKSPVPLYINATHAKTGMGKVFECGNLSLDAVMASSCLPYMFKTVEVDGEPYWEGSFSGCPALAPLINNAHSPDLLVVQIHPTNVEEVPTNAADILDRATEMSFNSVLHLELKTIALYNQMIGMGMTGQKPIYIHRIEAEELLASLGRSSKLNADWDFLVYLHDLGAQAARDWLEENYDLIGKRSSYDMGSIAA
jgi:NTE family protein